MLPKGVGHTRSRALKIGLLGALALVPVALAAMPERADHRVSQVPYLSEREVALARELAERELFRPDRGIGASEKVYFTKIELLPGSSAATTGREVMVTHYRYQGNQAILTRVDLHARQVVNVETVVNLPTPLAAEERSLAEELAWANPQVAALYQEFGDQLHVECKLGWPAAVADPTLPHRDVYLLFRIGRDYLSGPRVVVDLVHEQVRVGGASSHE